MENRGKLLIVFIFGTALVLSIFAWSFQFLRGRRVLELYGADAARLIRVDADRVELLLLGEPQSGDADGDLPLIKIDAQQLPITDTIDISKARGLIHARQALIEDSSYEWHRPPGDCTPHWAYALRFSHDDRRATAAFDVGCRRLRLAETGAAAPLAKHFVAGMQTFVNEHLPTPRDRR
jgi:hypothetical protein